MLNMETRISATNAHFTLLAKTFDASRLETRWAMAIVHQVFQCTELSIELAALDIDTVFTDSHAQVFHGENSATLAATLTTAAIAWTLNTKVDALSLAIFAPLRTARSCCSLRP